MAIRLKQETVISADGTPIGYVQMGSGPAVVIVHGSVTSGDEWRLAAAAIAEQLTCYVMDRRGRGRSGDAQSYSLQRECEDIAAVLAAAGPGAHLFGHSYGAICALETALRVPVGRLVLYEPPLPVDGPLAAHALDDYKAAIEAGEPERALVIAFKEIVHVSERGISAMQRSPVWCKMAAMAPTWTRELEVIDQLDPSLQRYGLLTTPALLLVGGATQPHHKVATNALAAILPNAQTVELQGQGHGAHIAEPLMVAQVVTRFLLDKIATDQR